MKEGSHKALLPLCSWARPAPQHVPWGGGATAHVFPRTPQQEWKVRGQVDGKRPLQGASPARCDLCPWQRLGCCPDGGLCTLKGGALTLVRAGRGEGSRKQGRGPGSRGGLLELLPVQFNPQSGPKPRAGLASGCLTVQPVLDTVVPPLRSGEGDGGAGRSATASTPGNLVLFEAKCHPVKKKTGSPATRAVGAHSVCSAWSWEGSSGCIGDWGVGGGD